jgi:hypothetical protein
MEYRIMLGRISTTKPGCLVFAAPEANITGVILACE